MTLINIHVQYVGLYGFWWQEFPMQMRQISAEKPPKKPQPNREWHIFLYEWSLENSCRNNSLQQLEHLVDSKPILH